MHILIFLALALLIGLVFLVQWLLEAVGLIKPAPVVPSGVVVGQKALRTLGRNTPAAERHLAALEKMVTLTDAHNGEIWRVLECKPAINNTYEFTLIRVG